MGQLVALHPRSVKAGVWLSFEFSMLLSGLALTRCREGPAVAQCMHDVV